MFQVYVCHPLPCHSPHVRVLHRPQHESLDRFAVFQPALLPVAALRYAVAVSRCQLDELRGGMGQLCGMTYTSGLQDRFWISCLLSQWQQ